MSLPNPSLLLGSNVRYFKGKVGTFAIVKSYKICYTIRSALKIIFKSLTHLKTENKGRRDWELAAPADVNDNHSPGAQKNTVFGPAAWFQSGSNLFGTIGVVAEITAAYSLEAIFAVEFTK